MKLILFVPLPPRHSASPTNLVLSYCERLTVIVQSHPRAAEPLSVLPMQSLERYRQKVLLAFGECVTSAERAQHLQPMLERFAFTLKLFNVVAALRSCDGEVHLLTLSPFERRLIELDPAATQSDALFYDKAANFHGGRLWVSLFHEPIRANMRRGRGIKGPDGALGYVLAAKLNATLKVLQPGDSVEYGNPTTASPKDGTGSLGQVIRGEVNVSLNARFLRLDLFQNNNIAEPTNAIGRDDMCVLVPRSGFRTPIHNFVHSLDANVWSLVVLLLLATVLCVRVIVRQSDEREFSHFHVIDAARSYFNQSLTHLPRTTAVRIAIIFWIIYCFVMANVFHCCLTSTFTVKQSAPQIESLDDLIESNYRIVSSVDYSNLLIRYVNRTNSTAHKALTRRLLPMEWREYAEYIGRRDARFAYSEKSHMTLFYANDILREGLPLFYAMRECPVPFLACYVAPFGSPLLGALNRLLGRLEQAGISRHWERAANSYLRPLPPNRVAVQPEPLRIGSLFAFYVLIGGHLAAAVAFAAEVTRAHSAAQRLLAHVRRKVSAAI